MPTNFFGISYNSLDFTADAGIYVDKLAVNPGWKQAKAEVEGATGGYIGAGYEGMTTVTISGKIIGTSGPDLRMKQRALLTALKSPTPTLLVLDSLTSYSQASPSALPTFTDTPDMLFCSDFAVVFICQPE